MMSAPLSIKVIPRTLSAQANPFSGQTRCYQRYHSLINYTSFKFLGPWLFLPPLFSSFSPSSFIRIYFLKILLVSQLRKEK